MKTLAIASILATFLFKDPIQKILLTPPEETYSIKGVMSSKDSLLLLYRKYNVLFPEIAIKQSFLETGNYSSAVYLENHNPHGMKVSSRKIAIDKNRGHAMYKSLEDGVYDYSLWQRQMLSQHENFYHKKVVTQEDYLFFLNHLVIKGQVYSYAEDPLYTDKLKKI